EIVVRDEPREALVLLDERPLPRDEIDPKEIVEALVAIVQADERLARLLVAEQLETRLRAFDGREVDVLARREIDGVDMPVLVPVLVLRVEDAVVRERPAVAADAALLVAGERLRARDVGDGRDPDVEDA